MENRTRKSARNMIAGATSQMFSILLSFISRTVFIHLLSVDYLGVEGLFSNVLTLLSLSELGISGAIVYAMYKPAAEKDYEKISQLVAFYSTAYKIIALVVLIVGFGLSFCLDLIISDSPNVVENLQVIFGLFLLNNACSYFVAEKQSILIVYQDKYIDSYIKQICQVAKFIFQVLFLIITHSYYIYLVIQVVFTLVNNIILAICVNKKYPWINTKNPKPLPKEDVHVIFRDVKALAVSKVTGVVSSGADNIIITKLLGLSLVGIVSNYNLVITAVNGILWQAINNLIGNIGNFNSDADLNQRRKLFDEVWVVTYWGYTFACVCLYALLSPFVNLWLGDNYTVDQAVVLVLVANMFAGGIVFPMYSFRITMGIFNEVKWYYVLSAVVNIVLSIVLGKIIGLVGIYLATIISRVFISDLAEAFYVNKQVLCQPFRKYILRIVGSTLLTVTNAYLVKKIVSLIPGTGIATFVIKVFVCCLLVNIILLLILYRTEAFKSLKERFLRLISGITNKYERI